MSSKNSIEDVAAAPADASRVERRKKNVALRKEILKELKADQLENISGGSTEIGTYSCCCAAGTNFIV